MSALRMILCFSLLLAAFPARADNSGDALSGLTPMGSATLGSYAGGTGITEDVSQITSTVTGNSMGDVGHTGQVSGLTMTGNNGLSTMINNTGNQVSISESTIVNVYMH